MNEDIQPPHRPSSRIRRLGLAAVAVALLAVAAPVAWASHLFTDVPNDHPFHSDIAAVQYAGITGGKTCVPPGTPPTYCPSEAITREAMAAFVHRGLSRTAFGKRAPNSAIVLPGTPATAEIASLTIAVGGVAGRTQTIKLDAVLTGLVTSSIGCPCASEFFITRDGSGAVSDAHSITNIGAPSGGVGGETGAVTAVVSVPTATTQTFRLVARRTPGGFSGTVVAYGAFSAITGAFGGSGGE